MYLTQTDIVKLQLENHGNFTAGQALKELIDTHETSDELKSMNEGVSYYDMKHKILDHDFRAYHLDKKKEINLNKSNNQIVHPYIGLLNDQKASYMVAKPISKIVDDDNYSKSLTRIMGRKFDDMMDTFVVNSANKGVEYLHTYINQRGEFDFVMTDSRQIIPIYDTSFQQDLIGVLRYYKVEVKKVVGGPTDSRYKLEYWDHEKVTFYAENDAGDIVLDNDYDQNPRHHWYRTNNVLKTKEGLSWGRVPFVQFKNNSLMKPDLNFTKRLIDDYDFQISDMSNKLVDVARLVWILKGYGGENLSEFVSNLQKFNAINVKSEGAVDNKSADIPHESYNAHLDRLEDNIYIFGRGVNLRKANSFGNSPSQVALKVMYGLLDLKCNTAISKLTLALEDFSWFATQYINMNERKQYDFTLPEFTFNKSIILNESELVDIGVKSKGISADDETIVANHPWVKDPKKTLAMLEKQKKDNGINLDDFRDEDDDE